MKSDFSVTVRRAELHEANMLSDLMRLAFRDAFEHNTRADDLIAHMDSNFTLAHQQAELSNPDAQTLLATVNAQPAGYAQIRPGPAPDCVESERPVQMQRFYLLKPFWGSNIANVLMEACMAALSQDSYSAVWLSCWDQNARALSFYRRWGFSRCGSEPFIVGSDRQTDFILIRPLGMTLMQPPGNH